MAKCKITVLERTLNTGIAEQYCQNEVGKCPCFIEGSEFITELEKPSGFCDWAWNDIIRFVTVLLAGGNFSEGLFDGWMKDKNTMITCCTDGIRPVIFKLEKIN